MPPHPPDPAWPAPPTPSNSARSLARCSSPPSSSTLAAVAALLIPLARGGEVTDLLPLALLLFVASSGLIVAALGARKKADGASAARQRPDA